jgi:hypothetical protein
MEKVMKNYRITEISGWYRVRDEKNNEHGCGNSIDEAVSDAMNRMSKKIRRMGGCIGGLKKRANT